MRNSFSLTRLKFALAVFSLCACTSRHPPHDAIVERLKLGQTLCDAGQIEAGVAEYRKVIAQTPESALAHGLLGTALLPGDKSGEAVSELRRAIALAPDEAAWHVNLGEALFLANQGPGAISELRKAIVLAPNDFVARAHLGQVLSSLGQHEEAISLLRQAVTIAPTQAILHANLGTALFVNEQFEEAGTEYQQALTLAPRGGSSPEIRRSLGLALYHQGKLSAAISELRVAVAEVPKDAGAISDLGFVLDADAEFEEAIVQCRRAISLSPESHDAHNNLGLALFHKGQLSDALAEFQEALSLNPADNGTRQNVSETIKRLRGKPSFGQHSSSQTSGGGAELKSAISLRGISTACFVLAIHSGISVAAQPPASVSQLQTFIKQLEPENPIEDRLLAVQTIGGLGAEAATAVPALLRTLAGDHDPAIRKRTIDVLLKIDDPSRVEIPALYRALSLDTSPLVRKRAAEALGQLMVSDQYLVQGLAKSALLDSDLETRQAAAGSLGRLGPAARDAVTTFRDALTRSPKPEVRAAAAQALSDMVFASEKFDGAMRSMLARKDDPRIKEILDDPRMKSAVAMLYASQSNGALEAIPDLRRTLIRDPDGSVRQSAAASLGRMRGPATAALPDLRQVLLNDPSAELRASVITPMYSLAGAAEEVLPDFHLALVNDKSPLVRVAAAKALGGMGDHALNVAPVLRRALLHDSSMTVRKEAASALTIICKDASDKDPKEQWNIREEFVPSLRTAFLHDPTPAVRAAAAEGLGFINLSDPSIVPELLDPVIHHLDSDVSFSASMALQQMGIQSRSAIPALIAAIRSEGLRADTVGGQNHTDAVLVLNAIVRDAREKRAGFMARSVREISSALRDLGFADNAREATDTADYLDGLFWNNISSQMRQWVVTHPWWFVGFLAYSSLPILWTLMLWFRPRSLIGVAESCKRVSELEVKGLSVSFKGTIETISFLGLFVNKPRVLDAWVQYHLPTARANFAAYQTVVERSVHVDTPVELDREVSASLAVNELRLYFDKHRATVLLCGDGGSGKTSLACQIARWAMAEEGAERLCPNKSMLPVLIEDDPYVAASPDAKANIEGLLLDRIHGQLNSLIGGLDPIPRDLLYQLLTRGRILVLLDGFSEYSGATRQAIRFDSATFQPKMIVVTSRSEEALGKTPRLTIRPLSIAGNRLSVFMDAYLSRRGMRACFQDSEYFAACARLTEVAGPQKITPMLAKMYAEMLIGNKQQPGPAVNARSIPELIIAYITVLNGTRVDEDPTSEDVIYVLKRISWECTKSDFKPTACRKLFALAAINGEEAVFEYIVRRLHLIQITTTGIGEFVRISIDPLAEYLGAMAVLESLSDRKKDWQDLLNRIDLATAEARAYPNFCRALYECCETYGAMYGVPLFVQAELARRLGQESG